MTTDVDRGIQPQRTALAWTRTALAMTVNALLVLRAGFVANEGLLLGWGVAMALVAAALLLAGAQRRRALTAGHHEPSPLLIGGTAVATTLGAIGAALVLVHG